MNHPLLLLALTAAGLYLFRLWREDVRATRAGRPPAGALPGATPATGRALVVAVAGALVLLCAETAGEITWGMAEGQSRMTWLLAAYSVTGAPVIEELIFRGWLVVENRGRTLMWSAVAVASVIFALLHPFLWEWQDTGFSLTLTRKGAFSTAVLFTTSLWLYAARLGPWNPTRSLLPCFAAHAAKNFGVVVIKASTGFMAGAW